MRNTEMKKTGSEAKKNYCNSMLVAASALQSFFHQRRTILGSLVATAKATQDIDFVFQQSCPVLRWAEVATNADGLAMLKF